MFVPIVDDYYKGMATTVPLHRSQLRGVRSLHALEGGPTPTTTPGRSWSAWPRREPTASSTAATAKAGQNDLTIVVAGSDEAFTVTALFDNLGKGASGAAVQNMNLMLGLEETHGAEPE